ncbi:MAG: RdgB/HAM1 family non-canonical purine NTP pyrophosphatase [Campylobacterota bacterium]
MKEIILATGNAGKVKELQTMLTGFTVRAYTDLIEKFEIVEDGDSFAQNAMIKAKAVARALGGQKIVIADDSGISVAALGNRPGIYSARFAGANAGDAQNVQALIGALEKKGLKRSRAYYTAAIALVCGDLEQVTHGWMHGEVINQSRGSGGFGYDPMFIPEGFDKTLGQLEQSVKKTLSHRYKAVALMRPLIERNCE